MSVSEDFIIFQQSPTAIEYEDSTFFAAMNAVIMQTRVRTIMDANATQALTCNIAILKFGRSLRNINAK
jgi:hypothetical protein